jgi:hypothetical protein
MRIQEMTLEERIAYAKEVQRRDRQRHGDVISALSTAIGTRARLTFPNGFQRVGAVEDRGRFLMLGGTMAGGEVTNAVRVERMGGSGRYETVAEAIR